MYEHNIKNIFIFLLLMSAGVYNENNRVTKKDTTIYSMADVLQSLLKLNEARYAAFKKLNDLNNIHHLRSISEKFNGNMFWDIFHKLATSLKLTFKPNDVEKEVPNIRYYDVYHNGNYIFTIPVPRSIDLMKVQVTMTEESDDKSNKDSYNNTQSLRYYSCRRGNRRCKEACREALRMTCILSQICDEGFFFQMWSSCKYACEDRFY